MPTVQRYDRSQRTDALPGARKSAGETDLSTGAGLFQAEGHAAAVKADALGRFGDTAGQVGLGLAQEALRKEVEAARQRDRVRVTNASNELDGLASTLVRDPETGALRVKGPAALESREKVVKLLDDKAGAIARRLTSDRQKVAFEADVFRIRAHTIATLDNHAATEMQRWGATELEAFVGNQVSEAIAAAPALGDPDQGEATRSQIATALHGAVARIETMGPGLGLGPESVAAYVAKTRTVVHTGVIESLLAQGRDRDAREYFEVSQDHISGGARTKMVEALETATTATAGLQAAESLWQQHGPTGETDPIHLDRMETAARERFANDPKVLRATIQHLRERKAGVDAGRQDRKEQTAGTLWSAVANGASLADLRRMPAYLNAPGALQVQISEHIVTEAEQKADRGYRLGLRQDAARARTEAAGLRVENEKERQGWAMLWHYDTPAILSTMTDNQVLALTPDLGIEHVNRLMTKKRALVKSDDTVRAATIDDDLFKTTAQNAGIDAYSPKTDPDKATLGQLRNVVETAIDLEQQHTGKTLTRERKQTLMRGIIDHKVMLDRWGGDTARIAATVVSPADRTAAYVPIAEIADTALNQWVNVVRSQFPREQRSSRGDILSRYRDRIQRAHAAAVLGLGGDEETRRLQGR